MGSTAALTLAAGLVPLLPGRRRHPRISVELDGTSTVQHLAESAGIPRTEIGGLSIDGLAVAPSYRPRHGDVVHVHDVERPQRVDPERFVLDVHLGSLARRMRLLGLDTAYRNDAADPDLVTEVIEERRVLLTRDRGLLRRRALPHGAYVRGDQPDDQLADVLDRFAPTLAPWTRCLRCNGSLELVDVAEIAGALEPGTVRTYDTFARCTTCGRPYWRGAHARRLEAIIETAMSSAAADSRRDR